RMPETIEITLINRPEAKLSPRSISPSRIGRLVDGREALLPAPQPCPNAGRGNDLEGGTFPAGSPHSSGNLCIGDFVRRLVDEPCEVIVRRIHGRAAAGSSARGLAKRGWGVGGLVEHSLLKPCSKPAVIGFLDGHHPSVI